MEWYSILLGALAILMLLMASGMPVAFCFMLINLVGAYFLWGGEVGLGQLIVSIYGSVTTFTLLPLSLFILMGETMFHAGISTQLIDTIGKWLPRLPGRLSLLALGAGALFSTLTGASMASVAMLGSALVPEMENHGYKKEMSLGPILGSGGLAIMIPPSSLAVLLGAVGEISIGGILIGIILPGILMSVLYGGYIIIRSTIQPHLAPPYNVAAIPFSEKCMAALKYVMPLGLIVFLVVGVIFFGIATPTEAAATGALGTFILTAAYGRLNWVMLKDALFGTARITVMIFMILSGAMAFSQLLAISGATVGLAEFTTGLPIAPVSIIIAIMLVILILGTFMESAAIIMVALPLFLPIVKTLGFDPVWFAVLFLLNLEMAATTPPFGMCLFVMKGVTSDVKMRDIYIAGLPFLLCDAIAMAIIIAVPALALWLPGRMQ